MYNWYVLVGLSAVMIALANIIRKHVLKHEHAMEELAAEAPFKLLILVFLIPAVGVPPLWVLVLIFIGSLAMVTLFIFRNKVYRHLPISTVAPLHNLSPVLLLLFAMIILHERPEPVQILGILLIILGGYALELRTDDPLRPLRHIRENKFRGVMFMLLLLMATLAIFDKIMLSVVKVEVLTYLFWIYFFITSHSLIINWYKYRFSGFMNDIMRGWYWLFMIAMSSFMSFFFFYQALRIPAVLVSLAIPIRRMTTLLEVVQGGNLFHEEGVWRKAAGCAIMLLGAVLIL